MNRFSVLPAICLLATLAGCGPMVVPMATRLEEKDQARVDEAWAAALSPPGKLDRQAWLDILVGAQAFERGVDRLHFRSEKSFAGGVVFMTVDYDRTQPDLDQFIFRVCDLRGHLVREERYTREDVMNTVKELQEAMTMHVTPEDPASVAHGRAEEARWNRVAPFANAHDDDDASNCVDPPPAASE